MELEKLKELIQIFEKANISELELEDSGSRVVLKKAVVSQTITSSPPVVHVTMPSTTPVIPSETALPPASLTSNQVLQVEEKKEVEDLEGLVTINAPMVGVFYAAPAPGEPPFVQIGDRVEKDQTVCIIEAMKLMNEITAKFPCIIERILVQNAEPVEFGQPLFAVRPLEQE